MTLDVCPDISEIFNIPEILYIPDIPHFHHISTIPEIPIII